MSILHYLLAGIAGGLIAGALAGFGEGLSVFVGDPSAGAMAPVYGVVFYAVLLSVLGGGVGLAGFVVSRVKDAERFSARWTWAVSLLVTLVPVAVVVVRFRVVRDVFHEKLALASGAGIGVHVGLLVMAAALVVGLWWLLRPVDKAPLGRVSWPMLTGAGLVGLLVLSGPFALLGTEKENTAAAALDGKAGDKPPVILIMVDTLRADRLGSYGYSKAATPNLDALAKDGVQFDLTFAQASWTRPSTATLLTSLPPSAHSTMYKADRLPESVETIAEGFKASGYRTGGLVTNYNIAPYFNFAQGFDDYRYLDPDYFWWADEGSSKLSLYNVARVVREKVAPDNDKPAAYYQDAQVTTDTAMAWIDGNKDRPFFLYVSYMDPHDPYFARPLNGEAYSRAATIDPDPKLAARLSDIYDGEIAYFDTHFGRLIAHLKQAGLYDKAVIAVTSDHGEEFQEHGGWWHGTTLYEEQIHVPLVIKRAGSKEAGSHVGELSRLLDVTPTLAAEAEVAPMPTWRGRNLFEGHGAPDAVFSEEDHQGNVLRSLRGKDWKLIEANANNPRGLAPVELYRIDTDRAETKNVAGENAAVVQERQGVMKDVASGAADGAAKRDQHELDEDSQKMLENLGYMEK